MSKTRLPIIPTIPVFPTGKDTISFSEIYVWRSCSFKHKLRYIDGIDIKEESDALFLGEVLHACSQASVINKSVPTEEQVMTLLLEEWESKEKDVEKRNYWKAKAEEIFNDATTKKITNELIPWLDLNFPNWEPVDTEEELIEFIAADGTLKFKGFIDAIIKTPSNNTENGGWKYHLIDWKSTNYWSKQKKQDIYTKLQLVLYKIFWSKKHNIPLTDIKCHFVLIKKEIKKQQFELVTIPVGEDTISKSLKILNDMIKSVEKGLFLKNRDSCKFCVFKNTKHCP